MLRKFRKLFGGMGALILILGFAGIGAEAVQAKTDTQPLSLSEQVRLELIKVPNLGVFDNIAFSMENSDTVVLTGQVLQPVVKSGAQIAVLRIPGIEKVVNNIEVLPLSPNDDEIRLKTYYAIYSATGFETYSRMALPPIRIIVKDGHVTLEGVVGNKMDKNMAEFAAKTVSGVFSVTDNLRIG